jgi:hypothetical protein
MSDCKLYSTKGELISEVEPQGDMPILEVGENQIKFTCEVSADASPRANVTVISQEE